jgi:hypothetical protein
LINFCMGGRDNLASIINADQHFWFAVEQF